MNDDHPDRPRVTPHPEGAGCGSGSGPLRIGVILSSFDMMPGGLETTASGLAQGLAGRGHAVTVIAGGVPGRPRETPPPMDSVSVIRVPLFPSDSGWWRWRPLRFKPGLPLTVQSLSFWGACRMHSAARAIVTGADVTVTFLERETVCFSLWRWRRGLPNVSYFPGCIDRNTLMRDRSGVRVAGSRFIAEATRRQMDLSIDGIVLPAVEDRWLDDPYRVSPRPRTLVFVGRLEANKGIGQLMEIFRGVAKAIPDLTLRLVGDGPLRRWIESESGRHGLSGRVVCLGSLPREGVHEELRRADVFLFPSRYETFGIAALEAMAVGVPAVCSDLPALREATGRRATLLPVDAPGDWIRTVRDLLEDAPARQRMSTGGRRWAAQCSWRRASEQMEGYLYRAVTLMGGGRRSRSGSPAAE